MQLQSNSNDIPQFLWKHKRSPTGKAILSKENNAGDIVISDLKLYYKATVTKTAQYQHKNTDKWNRVEDLEICPNRYYYLILDKDDKNYTWENVAYLTSG
jgi:hypothetical protein